ncbi:MAG: oligosaccharide flippase family protein [Chloroflexi bacterium]|nr:oligosaccharide flippase family protein [Chloroflexota bacterium]
MYFVRYIKRFDIKRSKSKRDLLQTGLTDILLLVTSLIAGVVTARLLGPEGRGQLAVVMLWPSLFAAVGSLGVRDALVYEQARAIQPKAVLTGVAIVLASLQSFFIILIGWFLIPILTKSQSSEIVVLTKQYLIFIFLNLTSLYMGALLQGKLRIALYNLVRLSVSVVYTLGLLTLWMFDSFNVQNVAYVLLIANAFTTLLAFIINLIDSGVSLHFHLSLFYSIFTYGIKNHIGSISHMFNERLDQMVLALLLTPKELGWYVVAVSAANIAKVAASPFSQLIFPRLAGQDLDNQRQIVRIHSRYTLLSTLLLILFLSLALPYLIPVIYGGDFSPSIKSRRY